MGMLKIAAGMLGVGLDDLAQREAQRRHRRLYAMTAASIAGMLFTSGLAYTAIEARDAARDQRREAEGLIGFMLGDLRQKLEPVGRLDVLDAVGARALEYFEKQDKSDLSDEALAQQWKALTLMGEIATQRGDMDGALRRYRQAFAGTEEALRRNPDDPQRMFDHAQSVYYVGAVAMGRGRIDEAARQFAEYRRLAERMIAVEPDNPKWQLEGVYSASNLGIVELQQARYATAAQTFGGSVGAMDRLMSAEPNNAEYRALLLEALAYHADALDRAGNLDGAIRQRQRQLEILAPYLSLPNPDAQLRQKAMIAHMALSWMLYGKGESRPALTHAADAVAIGDALVRLEPANADWLSRATRTRDAPHGRQS
jgi:tetratricopeptide (TPR) repeat protein